MHADITTSLGARTRVSWMSLAAENAVEQKGPNARPGVWTNLYVCFAGLVPGSVPHGCQSSKSTRRQAEQKSPPWAVVGNFRMLFCIDFLLGPPLACFLAFIHSQLRVSSRKESKSQAENCCSLPVRMELPGCQEGKWMCNCHYDLCLVGWSTCPRWDDDGI